LLQFLGERKTKSLDEILEEDVGRVGCFQVFLAIFLTFAFSTMATGNYLPPNFRKSGKCAG
jgi:hypothetical protein